MPLNPWRPRRISLFVVLIIILFYSVPFLRNDFIMFFIAVLLTNMVWSSSAWAIFHQAGQSLFAIVVIAAIGGYTNALLGKIILNTWITIPLALVVSAGAGIFFFLIANRVPGHIQFAILNLVFIFLLRELLAAFTELTGGIDGLKVKYFTPQSFFKSITNRYLVVLSLSLVSLFIIHKVMSSRFGRIITLIGKNPVLAATVGIDRGKYIFRAYLIFTPLIGLGGVLYSQFVGHISPEAWNPDLSLIIVFCALIGGLSNIWGPIVGTLIAVGIPLYFDITAEWRFGIAGIVAILVFVFKPEGLTEWIKGFWVKTNEVKGWPME